MESLKKGLVFQGVASAELKDQTNEIMSLEGMNIDDLESGMGILNLDHSNLPEDILGKILSARKIFSKDECNSDFEKQSWNDLKKPFLVITGELFNDAGGENEHRKAKEMASLMKRFALYGKSPVRLSVEGKVLKRDDQDNKLLAETSVSRVAITIRPCLKETTTSIIEDRAITKSLDFLGLNQLSKMEPDLIPDSTPIEIDMNPLERAIMTLEKAESALRKASVGFGQAAAPAARTGVAAYAVSSLKSVKKRKKRLKK